MKTDKNNKWTKDKHTYNGWQELKNWQKIHAKLLIWPVVQAAVGGGECGGGQGQLFPRVMMPPRWVGLATILLAVPNQLPPARRWHEPLLQPWAPPLPPPAAAALPPVPIPAVKYHAQTSTPWFKKLTLTFDEETSWLSIPVTSTAKERN